MGSSASTTDLTQIDNALALLDLIFEKANAGFYIAIGKPEWPNDAIEVKVSKCINGRTKTASKSYTHGENAKLEDLHEIMGRFITKVCGEIDAEFHKRLHKPNQSLTGF